MYGNFQGVPLTNALFGLVIEMLSNDPCFVGSFKDTPFSKVKIRVSGGSSQVVAKSPEMAQKSRPAQTRQCWVS